MHYLPLCPACRKEEPLDLGEHACPGCETRRALAAQSAPPLTDDQVEFADSMFEVPTETHHARRT